MSDTLDDHWVLRDGRMMAEGDAETINDMLRTKLELVRLGDWRILYRDRDNAALWEMTWPQGEMHGGGPRRLARLEITSPDEWADQ